MARHNRNRSDAGIFMIKLKSTIIGIVSFICLIAGLAIGIVTQSWTTCFVGAGLFLVLKYYADYVYFKYQRRCGHIIHYG